MHGHFAADGKSANQVSVGDKLVQQDPSDMGRFIHPVGATAACNDRADLSTQPGQLPSGLALARTLQTSSGAPSARACQTIAARTLRGRTCQLSQPCLGEGTPQGGLKGNSCSRMHDHLFVPYCKSNDSCSRMHGC